jgi:hypothetical protein
MVSTTAVQKTLTLIVLVFTAACWDLEKPLFEVDAGPKQESTEASSESLGDVGTGQGEVGTDSETGTARETASESETVTETLATDTPTATERDTDTYTETETVSSLDTVTGSVESEGTHSESESLDDTSSESESHSETQTESESEEDTEFPSDSTSETERIVDTEDAGSSDTDTDTDTDSVTETETDTPSSEPEPPCVLFVDNALGSHEDHLGETWETAFLTVQQGIDVAAALVGSGTWDHCEVWVTGSTYYLFGSLGDAGSRTDTLSLRDHVSVFGGFTPGDTQKEDRDLENNKTVLDGRGSALGADQVYHVATCDVGAGCGNDVTFDGFTVQYGRADGDGPDGGGGGMRVIESSMTVSNTTFYSNYASGQGGGLYLANNASTINHCDFVSNTSDNRAGAINITGGTVRIENSLFVENATLCLNESRPRLEQVAKTYLATVHLGASPFFLSCFTRAAAQFTTTSKPIRLLKTASFLATPRITEAPSTLIRAISRYPIAPW